MAYIGQKPFQEFSSIPTKDSFTGDGSTTTFDLANDVVRGAENSLEVFIDNVRQEPGSGKAFTLGIDGSSNYRRITFSSAPANGASIYVINDKTNLTTIAPVQTDFNGVEIVLDADSDTTLHAETDDQVDLRIAGVDVLKFLQSSGDAVLKPMVDAKDIIFQQFDGNKIFEINDGNFVGVGGNATAPGEIRIFEDSDNGTNYSGFKAAASTTSSVAYQLPAADGSSGTQLTTDGSGVLSWSAAGVTLANDANNRIVTATGSGLNGESGLTYDGSTLALTGAATVSSTLAVSGVTTSNAGVVVDNITIDGTEIDLSSGDLTIDVAGDIILDADGAQVIFKDAGTTIGGFNNSSSDLNIFSHVQDKDIVFTGDDGGSTITALTLDMSAGGAATFRDTITSGAVITSGAGLRIADAGTIGSASDTDAIAIGSDGDVTLTQDLELQHDGAILSFGANDDVSLTHVHDTGLLLNSTMKIQFNDASQFIHAPSATVLDIGATDEIELTATLIDVVGNATVSGTLGVTGIATFTDDIIIGDGKTIGSASDVDAITIASNGQLTLTQTLIGTALDISGDIDIDGTTNLDVVDIDGALTQDGGAVFNEASADVDFRVESNGLTHALFVDGGNNHVNVGTSTDHGAVMNIESSDNALTLCLASTDTDANVGPQLKLFRAVTGADNDVCGNIEFGAKDDSGNTEAYALIRQTIVDASHGSEEGKLSFLNMEGGSQREVLTLDASEVVINEDSRDVDFRVESDGNANMLFVDGGNDRVGIGTTSPSNTLEITGSGTPININSTNDEVKKIQFENSGVVQGFYGCSSGTPMRILNGSSTELMRIDSSSNLKFNSGFGSVQTAFGVRAWCHFDGSGTPSIAASGNISGITDDGVGLYTLAFSNAMPDGNYVIGGTGGSGGSGDNTVLGLDNNGTGGFRLLVEDNGGTNVDRSSTVVMVVR